MLSSVRPSVLSVPDVAPDEESVRAEDVEKIAR